MSAATQKAKNNRKMKILAILLAVLVLVVAAAAAVLVSAEHYTGRSEFCGAQCHIMKPSFASWKKDKHSAKNQETGKSAACIDCHYEPGEKPTPKAKFRGLGQLFSYLATGDKEVRKRATVSDISCTTADCHPREKFLTKENHYKETHVTEYQGVLKPFTHKTHLEKPIEGQKLHCTSCHMHRDREQHFAVPKDICFLCHFRKAKENEGRGKCAVCHEIPDKPLEAKDKGESDNSGEPKKPITHKALEEAKVSCSRCHLEMIIVPEAMKIDLCTECHHDASPELMAKAKDRKLMHEEHVGKQTARCFQCHETIDHKKTSYLDAAVRDCAACHPEPHFYTKKLLAGEGGLGVDEKYPSLMHAFGTNCIGCHQQDGLDHKGNKVKKGSTRSCFECHNQLERYAKMTPKWEEDVQGFLEEARETETETLEAVEQAKSALPRKVLARVDARLKMGQENLRVVTAGGGVHNKKYAMLLIDLALQSFEEAVAELEAHTPKGGKNED